MQMPAQQYPIYQPAMRLIANITQSNPAVITTTFAHQYITGLKVRVFLPHVYGSTVVNGVRYQGFGMEQINNLTGIVTTTDDPTMFTITIDSTNFDPFVIPPDQDPPNSQLQFAQVIPTGDINVTTQNAYIDVLPY